MVAIRKESIGSDTATQAELVNIEVDFEQTFRSFPDKCHALKGAIAARLAACQWLYQ